MFANGEDVKLIVFCLTMAGLMIFIQDCFGSGMILRRYYLWLNYYFIKWHKKKDRWKRNLLKPAGLCVYCSSPYLTAIMYFIIFGFDWNCILSIGGTHVILRIYNKCLN